MLLRDSGIDEAVKAVRDHSRVLAEDDSLDDLIDHIGDARIVLLGEASHGTSEYYTWRSRISKRLIREKGFTFIAVEGDWPDCYEVNRYVKGHGSRALDVLRRFDRWPTWMWANWEVAALAEWMRDHNDRRPAEMKVGFYGLDVYSLWESLGAVHAHLLQYHPNQVGQAVAAFGCFEPFNREGQEYAWHTRFIGQDCEDEVVELLQTLRGSTATFPNDPETHFNAEQNALVAVGAEKYYRAMVRGDNESWNIRDIHMVDTLNRLLEHHGTNAKAIVWEHNTHVGDARFTDMAEAGMVNVGQLVRGSALQAEVSRGILPRNSELGLEARADLGQDGQATFIMGFGSYQGSVIAGRSWGAPMESLEVPPATPRSWEAIFHECGGENRILFSREAAGVPAFEQNRGHRAIGVVYKPEYERMGNYVPTYLTKRYDAFLYLDRTRALHPLHMEGRAGQEPPETYPWGE